MSVCNPISQRAICIPRIIFKRNQIVELFDETKNIFRFLLKWNDCHDFVPKNENQSLLDTFGGRKIFISCKT